MDIKLSENVNTEIDKYISDIVGKLTEKYENRISSLEQRIAALEANERIPIHDNHKGQTVTESYSKGEGDTDIHQDGKVVAQIHQDGPIDVEHNHEGQNAIDIQQDGEVDANGSGDLANYTRDSENINKEHNISPNKSKLPRIVQSALLSRNVYFTCFAVVNHINIEPCIFTLCDTRNVEPQVAFFASLTHPLTNLGHNQDIPFDNVIINLGNGYNNNHGTFIAPVAGLYVFGVTLHRYVDGAWGHFVVNGNVIAKLDIFDSQISQMVIVYLHQGDDVSVQNASIGDRRNVETQVAFFASLTNSVTNLGANQDIPFDHVIINLGNGYNNHHGTFIAPVSGVYVFGVTLHRYGERTWAHFVVNGNVIAKFDTNAQETSQMVIIRLQQGDDVSVQNTSPGKALAGDRYSTFCGFLLYQ
ncbi:hypothetical protein ACF0H5_020021 [Mactra antiquata]